MYVDIVISNIFYLNKHFFFSFSFSLQAVTHSATSRSIVSPNPRVTHLSPAARRWPLLGLPAFTIFCNLYNSACNSTSLDQLPTSSLHHRCLGPAALLQLPHSAVPVYIVYPIVHTCYSLLHIYACTSTLAPLRMNLYACTSTRAPYLVNLTSCTSRAYLVCTSTRAPHLACTSTCAPHLVHLTSWTSALATLQVHLTSWTAPREPHLVHISCISTHVPLRVHLI